MNKEDIVIHTTFTKLVEGQLALEKKIDKIQKELQYARIWTSTRGEKMIIQNMELQLVTFQRMVSSNWEFLAMMNDINKIENDNKADFDQVFKVLAKL